MCTLQARQSSAGPASSKTTPVAGSALSLLASTQPAEPPPMMTKSALSISATIGPLLDQDEYDAYRCESPEAAYQPSADNFAADSRISPSGLAEMTSMMGGPSRSSRPTGAARAAKSITLFVNPIAA